MEPKPARTKKGKRKRGRGPEAPEAREIEAMTEPDHDMLIIFGGELFRPDAYLAQQIRHGAEHSQDFVELREGDVPVARSLPAVQGYRGTPLSMPERNPDPQDGGPDDSFIITTGGRCFHPDRLRGDMIFRAIAYGLETAKRAEVTSTDPAHGEAA